MHNMAGQYIRDAVLDSIQKTFLEELIIANSRLEEAKKVYFLFDMYFFKKKVLYQT